MQFPQSIFNFFLFYWLLLPFSYLSQCWRQKGVFQQSITLAGSKRNLKTIKAKERTKDRWGELWKRTATIRLQTNVMQSSKVSTQVLPYSWRSMTEWESAGCPQRCRRLLFSAASQSTVWLALERAALNQRWRMVQARDPVFWQGADNQHPGPTVGSDFKRLPSKRPESLFPSPLLFWVEMDRLFVQLPVMLSIGFG